jgi:hypothetical protein
VVDCTYRHENLLTNKDQLFFVIKSIILCSFKVSLYLARVTLWILASHFSKFGTLTRVMTRANQFENGQKTRTHLSHKIADSSHHYGPVLVLCYCFVYVDFCPTVASDSFRARACVVKK